MATTRGAYFLRMRVYCVRPPVWSLPLLAGAALCIAYPFVSGNPYANAVLYLTAAFGGTGLAVVSVVRKRLTLGWALLALGFAAWACGDLVWVLNSLLGIGAVPATMSDVFYLAAYPLLLPALFLLSSPERVSVETVLRQLIDAALLFVSGFCALWIFYGDQITSANGHSVLSLVYPTLDLVLLALVARWVLSSDRWPASYRLLASSLSLMFVADLTWRILLDTGSYTPGSWINTLFLGSYLLAGAAAAHPTAAATGRFSEAAWSDSARAIAFRLAVISTAVVVPGALLYFARMRVDHASNRIVLAASAVLLPLLALARAADLARGLRHAAREADSARRRTQAILEASPIPIFVMDRATVISVWNRAAEEVLGLTAAEVIGRPAPVLSSDEASLQTRAAVFGGERVAHRPSTLRRPDGQLRDVRLSSAPLDTEAGGEIVVLFEDVTHERRHRAALDELAHLDPLTDLPNRRSFDETLVSLDEGEAPSAWIAVLDIDGFHSVNEAAGYEAGNVVLGQLAALLRGELRRGNPLARLSGDEFAVVLRHYSEPDALHVVERLLEYAHDFRFEVGTSTVDLTMSAGLAPLGPHVDAATAFRHADDALYEAKRLGKNRVELWTPEIEPDDEVRKWSPLIKDALEEGRLELFLQPIVSLLGDAPETYEGLCRLRLPDGEIVEAGRFIEAAEHLGLMPAIDRCMLERAADIIEARPDLRIFVNLSPNSLSSAALLIWLGARLAELPPQSLGIEVTERVALLQPARAANVLARLIEAGALVAIDDFGLGFTSFRELATLPCHIVKIPAELARQARDDEASGAIAQAVTSVAHAYGKQVVIEGIETPESHERAVGLGIEFGQGWNYGRPVPSNCVARPELGVLEPLLVE